MVKLRLVSRQLFPEVSQMRIAETAWGILKQLNNCNLTYEEIRKYWRGKPYIKALDKLEQCQLLRYVDTPVPRYIPLPESRQLKSIDDLELILFEL